MRRMTTNHSQYSHELLYPKLSYKLQGCFYTVYNTLGFGHKELIYQRALEEELTKNEISHIREKPLPLFYNSKKIGEYRPDLVINDKIIVEIKALEFLPKKLITQLVYYLKGTEYKLGYLVNFGSPKLEIIRRIWSPHYIRVN